MKQKEGFQRMTIEQMKALKAEQELQKAVNKAISTLDEKIHEEAEKLSQELVDAGYDVDDFEISVESEVRDGKVKVHLKVVQLAKTLVFDTDVS
jgi:hypothetical protein